MADEQEKKPKRFRWLNMGTNSAVGLIMAYMALAFSSFYSIMYPRFPDIDPRTQTYLPKFNNVFEEGDEMVATFFLVNGTSRKTTRLANHSFRYGMDGAVSFSTSFNATWRPHEASQSLLLKVRHIRTKQTLEAKEELVRPTEVKIKSTRHLLTGEECRPEPEAQAKKEGYVLRGYPKLETKLIFDNTAYPPPWQRGPYIPGVFFDHTWVIDTDLLKLPPGEQKEWQVEANFGMQSIARHRFQEHMSKALTSADEMLGQAGGGDDSKMMREMLAQSDSVIFMVTMVVSILHTIFEILAFKHDVIFFQSCEEKDFQYISGQSIIGTAAMNIVVAVYLWDEGANPIIVIFQLLGLVLELWKVFKVMSIKWIRVAGVPLIPWFQSKGADVAEEDFDSIAMRWLMLIMMPCIAAFGAYQLIYECFRSWWAYGLYVAVSCVYGIGFVLMTPQVFINYKYKTVAYLPWKRFIYKALNTFIDDLFALIIKMPNIHRVSCLRDDVIFFIYLYQWWCYPVDKSRTFDEDGVRFDEGSEASAEPKKLK